MRTLLAEPRALLLDEPFNKLDQDLRERVRRFVFDHARRSALPTLLVTHDAADAEAAGGPVVSLPEHARRVDRRHGPVYAMGDIPVKWPRPLTLASAPGRFVLLEVPRYWTNLVTSRPCRQAAPWHWSRWCSK